MLNFILVVSQRRYNSLVVTGPSDGISMPCKDLQEGHLADDRLVTVQQWNGHLETLCVKASEIVWVVIVGTCSSQSLESGEFRQQETSEMFASTSPSFKPGNMSAFIFDSYHCPRSPKTILCLVCPVHKSQTDEESAFFQEHRFPGLRFFELPPCNAQLGGKWTYIDGLASEWYPPARGCEIWKVWRVLNDYEKCSMRIHRSILLYIFFIDCSG